MTFAVVDERGKVVAKGKDLRALQAGLKPKARESVAKAAERRADPIERTGITSWDFDSLDAVRDTTVGGNAVRAYPALVDDGSAVRIQLMAHARGPAIASTGAACSACC